MCYSPGWMAEVASRVLRNQLRSVLERVEKGEHVTITVDGRPVAVLQPLNSRPRWMSRADFATHVLRHQADPALTQDLVSLAPDMTDTLPL
jgi:prevent-host-death family protein